MIKRIVKIVGWIIGALGILIIAVVGRIDRSPIAEQAFYKEMMGRLDTLTPAVFPSGNPVAIGWTKVNITPATSMPMAGYTPRNSFDNVHDSLYARILTLGNGSASVAFVNVDLLLFPTILKARINEKLDSVGADFFLYLSATHTHNGVGGWDNSVAGRIILGSFNRNWVEKTAADIFTAITNIKPLPSQLSYWDADASDLVENRIDQEHGETDGVIRGVRIVRSDSSKATLFTFSAHPTSIGKGSRTLSADYPAAVISKLEETYDFGMFMAGMVGSHRFTWTPETDFEFIDNVASDLVGRIGAAGGDSMIAAPEITLLHVPIEFGPAQLRISKNLRLRNWVTQLLMRRLQGEATVVGIGNILFIGLPCDFSGEIFRRENFRELAQANGKRVIITSFNGDYNGYITFDAHYENSSAEEVNATNWVGPGYGAYFAEIIKSLIEVKGN